MKKIIYRFPQLTRIILRRRNESRIILPFSLDDSLMRTRPDSFKVAFSKLEFVESRSEPVISRLIT